MTDRRHWILDPAGHRTAWAAGLPADGENITIDGLDAVAIVPPVPDGDDWACDRCNATILTRWGDEPFPVPTDGDWALCHDCKTDQEARQSPWPAAMLCACAPCRQQAQRWRPQLERALGINHPRTRAPLN